MFAWDVKVRDLIVFTHDRQMTDNFGWAGGGGKEVSKEEELKWVIEVTKHFRYLYFLALCEQ